MLPSCCIPSPPVSLNTLLRSLSGTQDLKTDAADYFYTDSCEFTQKVLINILLTVATGSLYGIFLLGKCIYFISTVDGKMQVKGDSVNDLIQSIRTRKPGDHKVQFVFNKQLYKLEENTDFMQRGRMDLFDEHNQRIHTFSHLYIKDLANRLPVHDFYWEVKQLRDNLYGRLDETTRTVFKDMLPPMDDIPKSRNPSQVLGNQHNSTARLVLGAMMAGYLDLDDTGLVLLANAMRREAEILTGAASQSSNEESEDDDPLRHHQPARMDGLLNHMTFRSGYTRFINLINCDNDGLCADQHLDDVISKELMAVGAVFVSNNPRHRQEDGYHRVYIDRKSGELILPKGGMIVRVWDNNSWTPETALSPEVNMTSDEQKAWWLLTHEEYSILTEHGLVRTDSIKIMVQHINAGQLPGQPVAFNPTIKQIFAARQKLCVILLFSHREESSGSPGAVNLNCRNPAIFILCQHENTYLNS